MEKDSKYNYINLFYLNQMSSNNPSFILEMIDIYNAQTPDFQIKLLKYRQENNLNELIRIAHKIKGALAIMGVTCLDEILIHFEEGENISLSEFDTFIQSYIFTCNEVHKELNLVVNEYKNLVL